MRKRKDTVKKQQIDFFKRTRTFGNDNFNY